MPDARTDVATRVPVQDAQLASSALAVLDANWLGHATKPSPYLYPHQWSWDSACIAMGYARWNQDRARRRSFARCSPASGGTGCCRTSSSRKATGATSRALTSGRRAGRRMLQRGLETSGIVQPPIHATAAWRVYQRSGDRAQARAFLEELAPKLAAWHAYLYRERTRRSDGLVEIWHPWESGMDNSPALGRGARRGSARPRTRSPSTGASTPSSRILRSARQTTSTTATSTSSGSSATSTTFPTRIREATPFALQSGALQLAPRPVEPGPGRDRALARATTPSPSRAGRRRRPPASTQALGRGSSGLRRLRRVGGSDASACGQPRVSRRSMPESRPTSGRGG